MAIPVMGGVEEQGINAPVSHFMGIFKFIIYEEIYTQFYTAISFGVGLLMGTHGESVVWEVVSF